MKNESEPSLINGREPINLEAYHFHKKYTEVVLKPEPKIIQMPYRTPKGNNRFSLESLRVTTAIICGAAVGILTAEGNHLLMNITSYQQNFPPELQLLPIFIPPVAAAATGATLLHHYMLNRKPMAKILSFRPKQ